MSELVKNKKIWDKIEGMSLFLWWVMGFRVKSVRNSSLCRLSRRKNTENYALFLNNYKFI